MPILFELGEIEMVEKQSELEKKAREWLIERGVTIDDIADLVLFCKNNIILR